VADDRVAWFREVIAEWNRGNRELDWDRIAPSFELRSAMVGGVLRGPEGLRAYFSEIDGQFDAWELEVDDEHRLGSDSFLLVGSVRLRGRGSGLEMSQELAWRIGFEGEKAVEMTTFTDIERALAECGVEGGSW
jgi:ketosteroid isomerase-like protein